MKRMLLTLALLLPLSANAVEADDTMLTDYIGLTKVLRAQGIEPVRVQWSSIDMMCIGLRKDGESQVPYNRCRLEKAIDQTQFTDDSADCDATAATYYPKSATNPRPAILTSSTSTPAGTESTIATIRNPYLSYGEIKRARRAAYSECMKDRDWANPHNWQQGRTE